MIGRPSGPALLLGSVAAAVAVVVGLAVAMLDSPAEARRQRLDERRVDDLASLSDAVDAYWTRQGALPADLQALAGWQGLDEPPTDPQSGEPYGYRPTGERTFELCAVFVTSTSGREESRPWREGPGFWHHPAGEHCFALEVDEVER